MYQGNGCMYMYEYIAGSLAKSENSIAAPAVAGLVAYLLPLPDIGPMLRQGQNSIPQAVMQAISYRHGLPLGPARLVRSGFGLDLMDH